MTKEEAKKQSKKVYEEWRDRIEQIEKDAKEAGIWVSGGLDTNSCLFKDANNEAKEKIERIKAMITEK